MQKNAYLGAKIGFDAEENEPSKFGELAEKSGWSIRYRIFQLRSTPARADRRRRPGAERRAATQSPARRRPELS